MDANDFVTWLHGFVEACGDTLTREQCDTLRGRLSQVEQKDQPSVGRRVPRQWPLRLRIRQDGPGAEQEQGIDMRESADMWYKKITKQIEEDAKKRRKKPSAGWAEFVCGSPSDAKR